MRKDSKEFSRENEMLIEDAQNKLQEKLKNCVVTVKLAKYAPTSSDQVTVGIRTYYTQPFFYNVFLASLEDDEYVARFTLSIAKQLGTEIFLT